MLLKTPPFHALRTTHAQSKVSIHSVHSNSFLPGVITEKQFSFKASPTRHRYYFVFKLPCVTLCNLDIIVIVNPDPLSEDSPDVSSLPLREAN